MMSLRSPRSLTLHSRAVMARLVLVRSVIAGAALVCMLGVSHDASAQANRPDATSKANANPNAKVIRDPHYGDTVFSFYQSRFFTAITSLMTSQHFDRMPQHADEAEVLRGGMLLSYGLHREAGEIFAGLIDRTTSASVRDRAWFYLAKIRYQRGLNDEALAALGRVEGKLAPELQGDHALLLAQLRLARGDAAGAVAALNSLAGNPNDQAAPDMTIRYVHFNLGVALVKAGEAARGRELLDRLGRWRADDEEQRALRDRANVALGFAALQDDRPEDARVALQRVRLNSLHANKALLGFGWAQMSLKDAQGALTPWTELAKRDAADAAALEARIALPYAQAELGARGQALQGYESAVADFERETKALDESIAVVRGGRLMNTLASHEPEAEMGWHWRMNALPEVPHPQHLAQVMAEHAFQESFKNYRDLLFLSRNLAAWVDKLGAYGDMLATRRDAFKDKAPAIRAQASQAGLDAMARRIEAIDQALSRAESQLDATSLADERDRALLQRLERAHATARSLGSTPEAADAARRLRLAGGVLDWEMTRRFPERLWEAKKSQQTMHAQLGQARDHAQAIERAQREEPAKFEALDKRVRALAPRVQDLAKRVAALTVEQQQATEAIAVTALQAQQERLATYVRQARYAIAQLYDHAAVAQDDTRKDSRAAPR